MKELVKVYQDRGSKFIEGLFKDYIVITEKLSGSSFSFQKDGPHLYFYKGDNKKPLNLIDRTLMVYYEPPIKYIASLPSDIIREVPDNWRFSFQYFVHNKPGAITYDKLPKNSLVLTHIIIKDDKGKNAKIIEDPRVIKDWANRLGVTPMQPLYHGHLNQEQKEKLLKFLDIPVEDQMELFGTNSFVEYLIKSLNPSISSTLLNTDLSKPIDSIIFKFYKPGSTNTYSAKMVDPYTRSLMKEKEPVDLRRAPADINEIVLLDILAFLEERGLKKHEVLSNTPEEKYLELVSGLFNDYVDKRGNDLSKLDFQKADFSKAPEFDINFDLIRNEKTKKLISGSEALKDLFKVMLGSLRKKRDPQKEGPLFTVSVIEDFNKMVDKIKDITKEEGDGKFKTFEDYLSLKEMNEELYLKDDVMDQIFEERYLNYKDFVNLEKVSINEALRVPHKEQGREKVNMFVGRFQPFTSGHLKVLEKLHKENGLPVMIMLVRGGKVDPERAPFDIDTQQSMVAALQKQYPFIEGSVVVPNGAIDTMFSSLRPTYEPVLWGFGSDRKGSYNSQIQNDNYRNQLGVLPEFEGHEIRRGDEDVSASKVRKALEIDDRKTYEKMVPRSLHSFYDELKNIMVPIEEGFLDEAKKGKIKVYNSQTKSNTAIMKSTFDKDQKSDKSKYSIIEKPEGEEEEEEEGTEEIKDFDKKKNKGAAKMLAQVDKIEDEEQKVKAIKVLNDLIDYENAETDPDKKAALEALIKSGNLNRNATGSDTHKIYLGQNDEFEGKSKSGTNTATGLRYQGSLGGASTAYTKKILADAERLEIQFPLTKGAKRMSGARVSPNVIHLGIDGKPATPVKVKHEEVKGKGKPGEKGYEAPGVRVGGKDGIVMRETPPFTETQKENRRKKYKTSTDPNRTEEEIDRLISIDEKFRKQNNKKIALIREGKLTIMPIIKEVDGKPVEINVFTKKGQREAVGVISKNVVSKVDSLLSVPPPPVQKTPQLQKGMDDFKEAGEKFAKGEITQEEFQKAANALIIEFQNDPNTRPGVPFLVETFAMMEDLSKGRASVSPDKANFPVADVITFDAAELPPEDPNADPPTPTPEQINEHINLMSISGGSRSIKHGIGGASQSLNKINATDYADYVGEDGKVIKGEVVKEDLVKLGGASFDDVWNPEEQKPPKPPHKPPFKDLDKSISDGEALAEKYGSTILGEEPEGEGLVPMSDEWKERYEERATADGNTRINKIKEVYAAKDPSITLSDAEAKELLIKRWHATDVNGFLMQDINNKQQMAQNFTNRSYDTDPPDSAAMPAMSEEEAKEDNDIMKDADGNPIPVMEIKDGKEVQATTKKGTPRWREKQTMNNEETNGVSELACMKYEPTPDFSESGRPNNKMPARVKKCGEGNKWLGYENKKKK